MIDAFADAAGYASDPLRRTLVRLACDYAVELQTDSDADTELACAWAIGAARRFVDDDCSVPELLCAIDSTYGAMNSRVDPPLALRAANACAIAAHDFYFGRSTVTLVDIATMLGSWAGDISVAQMRLAK